MNSVELECRLLLEASARDRDWPAMEHEYVFDEARGWRVDYAFPSARLAVEVEGGAWIRGRHTRGKGFIEDMAKYNALVLAGWRLLRFTPDMVRDGTAERAINAALATPASRAEADAEGSISTYVSRPIGRSAEVEDLTG